jgi:hypothetical protein
MDQKLSQFVETGRRFNTIHDDQTLETILNLAAKGTEEEKAKYYHAIKKIAGFDPDMRTFENLQRKSQKFMFIASVFMIISSLIILSLAAYDILSKRQEDKKNGATYTALLQKRDADRKFAMHWNAESVAARAMVETQELLGMDPTYWSFGPHGFAVWVNYRFAVDLVFPTTSVTAVAVGEPKPMFRGPLQCLSEVVVRDEELDHHFAVFNDNGTKDDISHTDTVSVSADVSVPDDRKGFVHSAIALLENCGSTFYFDKVRSRFTTRCKSVPLACILLAYGLKAVFTTSNGDLKALRTNLQKDWLAVSSLDTSEIQKFVFEASFVQTGTPSTLTSTSLSIEYSLKYNTSKYPELGPSLYAFKQALEIIQNLTMNFVPDSVFVGGKYPTEKEMIWTEEMRNRSMQ